MTWKIAVSASIAALVALLLLFDIRINFEFSLPGESTQLDVGQEARYKACYDERDREIHHAAFGTIDNPDVQKLYISSHRAQAARECRKRFPEQPVTVEEPFHLKVIDLRFRY